MEKEKIQVLKFDLGSRRPAVVWITNTIENFKKNIGMPGEADEMFLHYMKHLRCVRGERVLVAVACIDGKEKGYALNRNVWNKIKIFGDFFITAYEQKAHAFKSLSDTEIAEIKKTIK